MTLQAAAADAAAAAAPALAGPYARVAKSSLHAMFLHQQLHRGPKRQQLRAGDVDHAAERPSASIESAAADDMSSHNPQPCDGPPTPSKSCPPQWPCAEDGDSEIDEQLDEFDLSVAEPGDKALEGTLHEASDGWEDFVAVVEEQMQESGAGGTVVGSKRAAEIAEHLTGTMKKLRTVMPESEEENDVEAVLDNAISYLTQLENASKAALFARQCALLLEGALQPGSSGSSRR